MRAGAKPIAWAGPMFLAFSFGCPPREKPQEQHPPQPGTTSGPKTQTSTQAKPEKPPPKRIATQEEMKRTLKTLRQGVKKGARDANNPWALAHGLLAFGKELRASNGELATDTAMAFLEKSNVDGKTVWAFPQRTKDHVPVEPHRNSIVLSLLSAGVPLDHSFRLPSTARVTLKSVLNDSWRYLSQPDQENDWKNHAWTLSSFLVANRAMPSAFSKRHKTLKTISARTLDELSVRQAFLAKRMKANEPEKVEKRKQGIYGHTCGGLHFVQAAVMSAAYLNTPEAQKKIQKQLQITLFRWEAERRIYQSVLKAQPRYKWLILVQELKFYGHVLETFALAHQWGVLKSNEDLKTKLGQVAHDLGKTVAALKPAYQKQESIRDTTNQTYLDMIGDGCHAIRGLEGVLVAFF